MHGIGLIGSVMPMLRVSFFFSSRRRHTRLQGDWSSDVCSSDLGADGVLLGRAWAYALAARGEAGVAAMLAIIKEELEVAMALTGQNDVRALDNEIGRASCRERV